MLDIRQSENWAKYLKTLGWESIRTSSDVNIEFKKLGFTTITKIQRPRPLNKKDLEEVEKICREKKALFIKIEPSVKQKLQLMKVQGYVISNAPLVPPTTIYINLQKSEAELWKAISHSGKYSIRRGKREGAKVEYFKNPPEQKLKEFYGVEKETGKKKKFFTQNYPDLKAKWKIFGEECYLLFVYDNENRLCGTNLYLGFNENIWYIHGGTTEIGRKNKTGYELVWQSFLYFKKLGYKTMDLEGKDDERFPHFTRNWGGFSHFKEKFGGDVIQFPEPRIKYLNKFLALLSKCTGNLPL